MTTVNELRKDLAFQLQTLDELDWDHFIETAIKAKIAADFRDENFPAIDRTLNEIIEDAKAGVIADALI